ncbi:hypothetical protein Pelo_18683 [Pelomyxa schiedti]|nr:hypothetical protein Pelo_18683 [Pelomyxa schiedti]
MVMLVMLLRADSPHKLNSPLGTTQVIEDSMTRRRGTVVVLPMSAECVCVRVGSIPPLTSRSFSAFTLYAHGSVGIGALCDFQQLSQPLLVVDWTIPGLKGAGTGTTWGPLCVHIESSHIEPVVILPPPSPLG